MTLIDEIKAGIDIVDLVGESLALRKAGPTFKAPCPFHTERTPSFIVDPRRQTWHCFGACSEGGDVFSWVMKRQGVEFREALRILADRAGIRLTPLDARAEERAKRLERLRSANETAAAFYRSHLLQEASAAAARAYLEQRGVAEEVAEAFALGYAPDQPDALLGYLSARGFVAEELTAAGLLMEAEQRRSRNPWTTRASTLANLTKRTRIRSMMTMMSSLSPVTRTCRTTPMRTMGRMMVMPMTRTNQLAL